MKEQKVGKEFDRMLVEAVKGRFSFFAWNSLGGIVEKCELKIRAYRKDYNEIEFEVDESQHEFMAKVISGKRALNIYVPESSVSFSAEIKAITADKKIKIHLPRDYSFYERRKHERLQPSKPCFVSFDTSKNLVKKSIYDISLGGIAIIFSKAERVPMVVGKEYPSLVIEIRGRRIKVKAECANSVVIDRYKLESLPYGGFKVSFRFTDMSPEDKAYLVDFIATEALIALMNKAV